MHSEYDIRMKSYYEKRSGSYLTRRVPVIIRIDGKCFSSFCKRFEKPYDKVLNNTLNNVMVFLCKNIQGAKFAERHSDEISIFLSDYDSIQTDAYFDYNAQKICSVVASMTTAEFIKELLSQAPDYENSSKSCILSFNESWPNFDCRCFNIPKEEVTNYFWWRMLDAKRGSVNMLAQSIFSHKDLQGLSCDQIQEKLFQEKGINWNDLDQGQKIGFVCHKIKKEAPILDGPRKGTFVTRNVWNIYGAPKYRSVLDCIIPIEP